MSFAVPESTKLRQARASNPETSAWVSANAGSGKTHVLAQRVIRLLLGGAAPGKILCLTFTKAAAANMAERVFTTLGQWTALDDAGLRQAIEQTGAEKPDVPTLSLARKLFARAVETPGGLKIQTLHAFCERVLHAAPFEANVAAGFVVLDDADQAELIARAQKEILAQAESDAALGAALSRVADDAGLNFEAIFREVLTAREFFGPAEPKNFWEALGLEASETPHAIGRAMLEQGFAPQDWPRLIEILRTGGAKDSAKAENLAEAQTAWRAEDPESALDSYLKLFFTEQGAGPPPKSFLFKPITTSHPELLDAFAAEAARLEVLRVKLKSAKAAERSAALQKIAGAILARYKRLKNQRQAMDYDDLIVATQTLLARSSAAWVLKKLDDGIDHILVDEAQDTSAAQWEILEKLTGDFFVGAGQNPRPRTFFAVGDEKQSIFSFQGAAPKLFAQKRDEFQRRAHEAQQKFDAVELILSFRSAQGVLKAVDEVFSAKKNYDGLSARDGGEPTVHEALKTSLPARIEIWDVIAPSEKPEPRDWKLPLDFRDETDPPVASARRIAKLIESWLAPDSPERVMGKSGLRQIQPGDVMILVRARNAFFHAMIRALREAKIPAAGADRLKLGQHIAVMDLIALGRAALTPADDLTLAEALKSPIFGFDDEDLLRLAPRRASSLRKALQSSIEPRDQKAAVRLDSLANDAAKLSPFGFFARLLGPQQGRREFIARLGAEAGDALDEFLNLALAHERARAPSLKNFLDAMAALDIDIKRDMDMSSGMVRVMTIHAAKGLEGKIVFLPDVCAQPKPPRDGVLFPLTTAKGEKLAIWSPKKDDDPETIALARQQRAGLALEEYRRLFYVALTRAEERLYIAGHRGAKNYSPDSWRAMIEQTLLTKAVEHPAPWSADDKIWRFGEETVLDADAQTAPAIDDKKFIAPDWLSRPARAEAPALPPLRPSSALEGADALPPPKPLAPRRAEALEDGRQIHRLLQHLPALSPAQRREAAQKDCEARGFAPERAEKLIASALAVIEDPRLAPLFGPQSFAELRLTASLDAMGGKIEILGAIDRLAETDDAIWIADYKSGAERPTTRERDVVQLALYGAAAQKLFSNKPIRAILIHTEGPRVEEISTEALAKALAEALKDATKN